MSDSTSTPPNLIADLKQQLRAQQAVVQSQQAMVESQQATITRLEKETRSLEAAKLALFEQLRLLIENRFGPSTEKYSVEQKDLFFNEAEALVGTEADDAPDVPEEAPAQPDTSAASPKCRTRGGRVALPPELPRVDVVHDLADDQKHCHSSSCGNGDSELVRIGEEISEQLDVIPAKIQVIRHIRPKYACRTCEEGVAIAALPPQPLPKSNASPALLAYCVIAKYVDALPLYRQEKAFQRLGIDLPRNTLARWMIQVSELITPLMARLRQHLLASPLIHMDETTLQVNSEPDRKASSTSYMWVQRGGPPGQQVVLFDFMQPAVPGKCRCACSTITRAS